MKELHVVFVCDGCASKMSVGPIGADRTVAEISSTVCPVCDDGRMDPANLVEVDDLETELAP